MGVLDRPVMIGWQAAPGFGWGVIGINLMLCWARQQAQPMITGAALDEAGMGLGPIEAALLQPAFAATRELHARLEPFRGGTVSLDVPVLHALGNDLGGGGPGIHGVTVTGSPSIALPVFEATTFSADFYG